MTRRAVGDYYENADGSRRVSVTTVLKVIDKPNVDRWSVNQERAYVCDAAAQLHADLQLAGKPIGRMAYVESLRNRIGKQKAWQKAIEKAASIGIGAHARAEWEIKRRMGLEVGKEPIISGESLTAYQEFESWWSECGLEPVAVEEEVWSEEYGFQGTMDLLCRDKYGCLVLPDLKTSKAIYGEASLQVSAYIHAVNEMKKWGACGRGVIARLPKVKGDRFETRDVTDLANLFPVFLSALELWKWQQKEDAEWRRRNRREAA